MKIALMKVSVNKKKNCIFFALSMLPSISGCCHASNKTSIMESYSNVEVFNIFFYV